MRMCREGFPFILGSFFVAWFFWAAGAALESGVLGFLAGVALLGFLFCCWFFRNPKRTIPMGDRLILSPAYGKVMEIIEAVNPQTHDKTWVIRIFLSVFDAHLQLAPVAGRVTAVTYTKGKFLDARDPKAAFENEQNRIEFEPAKETGLRGPVVVMQIAGLIARRIVCDVAKGHDVQPGDKIGLIRFGSQVDMIVPSNVAWRVKVGDKVSGCQVLAEVK